MQELSVVGRLFPLILDGSKTSTIRWNERPITPGLLRYVNTLADLVVVVEQLTPHETNALSVAPSATTPDPD